MITPNHTFANFLDAIIPRGPKDILLCHMDGQIPLLIHLTQQISSEIVGTVETRVPRAGLPRPTTLFRRFSLRTRLSQPVEALQAWRRSSSLATLAKGQPSARDLSSRGHRAKGSVRPPASQGFLPHQASSISSTERTWALRSPQSHGRDKAR